MQGFYDLLSLAIRVLHLNCKLGRKITKLFDHGNSIKKHLRSYYNQKREIMRKVIQNTVFIEMMIQC
ncbi:hypothetical protein CPZ13_15800 [Lacticaseibacillus paracasei]|nr:hypothetical protein CFM84_07060 [Lacticaseibacillus paracasei]RDV41413.1 hypothetical protein DQM07_08600 [Lacticaseibacillus paracasei subsp. paracasei]MCT3327223.1 hypothetical protein [Lacticaseibacillus paracasei]MCT3379245.1 hypothetical protein [Lacticaseibacillus paracasei]OSP82799.1 hypothetical protein B9J76_17225 [Lacticaseibacillus paracasei]